MGADASKSAANAQVGAANRATDFQKQMYGDTVGREQPFLQGGTNAFAQLQQLLGIGQPGGGAPTSPILQMLGIGAPGGAGQIDPRTFQGSPGYQFARQEGLNAVTNSAHGNIGGNALRALQTTGQGLANQGWNQYLGNASNAWGNLISGVSGVANQGQNAAVSLGGFGQNLGGQVGGNIIGGGNAMAGGDIGSARAITGGMNGGLQGVGTAFQNPQFQQWLKGLIGPGANDGSGTPSYISLDPTGQSVAPMPTGGW